ncbi:MAG: YigZ family protein [Oscillospiraceae bacterium]|jgi:uncharacterized YigZ family protein|nr:YigZ family protein [Oscillospiraceae bacterium]
MTLVPLAPGEAELIEKRSRFLARVLPCTAESEALDMIRDARKTYSDATHNVYAYIIRDGGAMRYSDDGEPGGTAGMPVLDVFRKAGVGDFCCVVTRWFGGTLLGTGGLVRAYSEAAKLALEASGIGEVREYSAFGLSCPYALADKLRYALSASAEIEDTAYGERVEFKVLVPAGGEDALAKLAAETTSGSVVPVPLGARKRAVPVK